MLKLGQIRKALAPLAIGALYWAQLVVSSPSGPITSAEWLVAGGTALSALGVYSVTNAPPKADPPAETVGPIDIGA